MADAAVTAARGGKSEAARSMEGGDMDASRDHAGGADADDDDDGGGGGEKAGVR